MQISGRSVEIEDCQILYKDAIISCIFTCKCPDCGANYRFQVHKTFIFSAKFKCPKCFSVQKLDYETIKQFIEKNFVMDDKTYENLNSRIYSLFNELNADTIEGGKFPLIARYMGLGFIFYINQLSWETLRNKSDKA
jgi:hypothetical protein